MKKILPLVSGLLMLANFSFAQIITFDKTFDSLQEDKLVDVVQTSDGGYAAIGSTQGLSLSPAITNIYVIKYNQFGDTLWTEAIGGSNWTYPGSIQQTSDGGYIICGWKTHTTKQAFIAKLNANGSIVWEKLVGNGTPSIINADWFRAVKQNPDGTFVAAGSTRRSNSQDSTAYAYLVKFDFLGNTLWEKTYSPGFGKMNSVYDLEITTGGGYLLTGLAQDPGGYYKSVLIKTDGQGAQQWVKSYAQFGTFSGKQTSDGGFIIAGEATFGTSYLGNHSALLKLNSMGDTLWTKKYPGIGANSVVQTTDGGYAFTGSFINDTVYYGTYWPIYYKNLQAVKTDAAGNMRFMRSYGDSINDAGLSIKQTTDGGFVIAGLKDYDFPYGPHGPEKGLLLKIEFTNQDAILSVKEYLNQEILFNLFPNPATTQFTLELSEKDLNRGNFQLIITNVLGEQVLRKKVTAVKTVVERGNLKPGLYFVQLLEVKTGKLMVQKKLILN